jgi:hypothetical protein
VTVTTTGVSNQYTANGATTVFSYTFVIKSAAEVVVRLATTTMALTTDYTVQNVGNPSGGTITFNSAPLNGVVVTLTRSTSLARSSDYQSNGTFYAIDINGDLDRLTKVDQELTSKLGRAVSFPYTSTFDPSGITMPDPQATRALRWNSLGTNLENFDLGSLSGTPVGLPVTLNNGGTGASDVATARTNLGLGTMAVQNAANLSLTMSMSGAAFNEALGSNIVAAPTIDIGSLNGNSCSVTNASGATNITALGTAPPGARRLINFSISGGSITLIHSGNLACPGGLNLPISSGDWIDFRSNGSGSWTVVGHLFYNTFASAAVTLGGADTLQALTAGGFAGNKSLAANGYYKFPGGLIIQWGSASVAGSTASTITFPTGFPTACDSVTATYADTPTSGSVPSVGPGCGSITTSNFALANGSGGTHTINWIAIGH